MKIATIIVRVLLGLVFIFASVSFFLKLAPEPVTTGDFKAFQIGLVASSYLIPLAKGVELLCGISFLIGKYVTLANIVILPVTLNILMINYFMAPETLFLGIAILIGNLFLIYSYRKNYKTVLTS